MKKLAIGCGIVILLLGIVGAGAAYYIYSKIGSTVAQFAELAQVPEIEREITNRTPFAPPASGDLTREQVERLVRVQGQIRDHLGTRIAEIESRYKTLLDKNDATVLDLPQLMTAYRDLASTWVDAKRLQVDALNETSFSLDEYRWVRERAYAALGVPFTEIDISRLIESARDGQTPDGSGMLKGAIERSGSPANVELVEPFRKQLERNIALAALGL